MNTLITKPKPLKQGAQVALITPGGQLESLVEFKRAELFVKSLGLIPITNKTPTEMFSYINPDDFDKIADLHHAFSSKEIDGIFCLRGGYGCARLLDKIDYDLIGRNPKVFCGYSDITALHTAINQRSNLATFHTPMPSEIKLQKIDEYTDFFLKRFLFSKPYGPLYNPPEFEWEFFSKDVAPAEGVLCGGNLTTLISLLATPYEINTNGKILFIEDINEPSYKIDRALNQLRLAGKFDFISGVILGDFGPIKNERKIINKDPFPLLEIFYNLNLNVPILYNFKCGHCLPTASLPLGAVVRLVPESNLFEIIG